MDSELKSELREKGENLRARHDDAVIADVIGEVESLDTENAEITGNILRVMADFEE